MTNNNKEDLNEKIINNPKIIVNIQNFLLLLDFGLLLLI